MPTTTNIAVTVDCIELIPNIYKPNLHSRGNDLIFQLNKDASSLLFQGITSKTRFYNYQPQPKYSWALSKIEGKGKLGKTKDL